MKRKIYLQAVVFLVFLYLAGTVSANQIASPKPDTISVLPGKPNTQIEIAFTSPISVLSSYYSSVSPPTIILDLDSSSTQKPRIHLGTSSLVSGIDVKENGSGRLCIYIRLKEKVPYRIFSSHGKTFAELNSTKPAGQYISTEHLQKAPNETVFLDDIRVTSSQDKTKITAKLSGRAETNVFALADPLRLVVDLYATELNQRNFNHTVNKHGITRVRTAQFQKQDPYTITRMVFDLKDPGYYSLDTNNDQLIVTFYGKPPPPAEVMTGKPEMKNEPEPVVEEKPKEKEKPKEQEKPAQEEVIPVFTKKFSVPKSEIEKPANGSNGGDGHTKEPAVLPPPPPPSIETKAEAAAPPPVEKKTEESRKQDETPQKKQAPIEFTTRTLAESEQIYKGEVIGLLKFKDADLRDVILYLGEFASLNVVFDPDVRGTVTCNLSDIPWDQALDIILKNNKMGKTMEGNVLRIAPVSTLTREQTDQQKMEESKEMAGPVQVKSFTLSYSKANEVQGLLRSKISSRGEIIVDERTNVLIITDVKERMALLEELMTIFDTPTPQVSIEARIVEATSSFVRNLGVQWGWRGVADPFYGNQTSVQFPNKVVLDGAQIPQGIVTKGIGGPLGGYAINLPAPAFSSAVGFSVANVLDTFRLDMALSALERTGEGKIISCPTVTTQNNKEAEIIQGRQIPVQTVANFTVTTRYQNAALELRATPQITAEGTIIMDLEIRNNAADFANLVNGIPPMIIQSASTTVMVPDGGTTVIGGIYRTEDSITREKVPFLHKIPILGGLFKSFARTKQSRELLIFITPRIIK